jgi:23S rRNA pseudouridine2605 synthase
VVHKPAGVLTTTRDPRGRRTVLDLLPPGLPRLFPVGRLDFDSEGLVLLTNDGDVAHALLHPSLGSEREYRVTARGRIPATALAQLAAGVVLDDGPTAPARVGTVHFDARAGATRFGLTLREGRKRQIRRALDALGHPVVRLVRVRMGPVRLGRLPAGGARPLLQAEIAALRRDARRRLARHASRQRAGSESRQAPDAAAESAKRARSKAHNRRRND